MIFAREVSDNLTGLVKKIDAATEKNSSCNMGSFVVFLNDDESLEKKLQEMAKKADLKKAGAQGEAPVRPGHDRDPQAREWA